MCSSGSLRRGVRASFWGTLGELLSHLEVGVKGPSLCISRVSHLIKKTGSFKETQSLPCMPSVKDVWIWPSHENCEAFLDGDLALSGTTIASLVPCIVL